MTLPECLYAWIGVKSELYILKKGYLSLKCEDLALLSIFSTSRYGYIHSFMCSQLAESLAE